MVGAFFEAIRATFQPCTFLLVAPMLIAVLVAGATWTALAAVGGAAVLGGWLLAGNWWILDGGALQWSAALALSAIVIVALSHRVDRLAALRRPWPAAGFAFGVALIASLWWRPCVGEELGAILTASQEGVAGQLPGMTAYMLGAMLPVVAVVLAVRVVEPRRLEWVAYPAAALGLVVAGSLMLGAHDQVVVTLTRWST